MGLFGWIKALRSAAPLHEVAHYDMLQGAGSRGEKPWPFDYNRAVWQCKGWVYRCAYGNAERAASVPLRLFTKERAGARALYPTRKASKARKSYMLGDRDTHPHPSVMRKAAEQGGELVEVMSHPLLDMLRFGNVDWTGFDLHMFRFLMLELTGMAYTAPIVSPDLGRPVALQPLWSQWMHIIPAEKESGIGSYLYGHDVDDALELKREDVLYQRVPNPRDPLYGYGKVEAAWEALGLFQSERIYQKALFDNHARPDWAIMPVGDQTIPEESRERMQDRLANRHRGVRNSGKPIVFPRAVEMMQLQWSPAEVGTDERLLEEIAGVFGYPLTKLKSNDPNRANAESGDAGWLKDTIRPMITRDEQWLNDGGLLSLFPGGEDLILCYDDPVPSDNDALRADLTAYVQSSILTPNEARAELGHEAIEGGDELQGAMGGVVEEADPFAALLGSLSADNIAAKAAASVQAKMASAEPAPAPVEPVQLVQPDPSMQAAALMMLAKHMGERAPDVSVHVPEAKTPDVHVHVPDQPAPVVEVKAPEAPPAPAPVVNVNVEPTPVQIDNQVNVESRQPRTIEIQRDGMGNITSATTGD